MTLLTIIAKMSEGLGKTCAIFFLTLLFSLPLGMIITFLRMSKSKVISSVTRFVVAVLRGTPLMLQIFAIYFAIPTLTGVNLDRMNATILAFSINYAAYFAEIFRGGIQSIPVGQREAGQVLGMTRNQIFRKVVFMQVVKRIIPPMSNEIITLVKDTSLARVISVYEIIWAGEKFMKLDGEHIRFVLDCMRENTTKIRNIKQYLKAALFNAPSTIGNYYTSLVAHDMASGALSPKKPQYGDPDYYSCKPGESL